MRRGGLREEGSARRSSMPITSETGRRGGGGGRHRGHEQVAAAPGSSSSGRGSDSRAAVMQCSEGDDADGEVESSYTGGALDTMDTLQDALPANRSGVSKISNGHSGHVADAVSSPQHAKEVARPANPSPKKRKGLLPFSFSWSKARSKEASSRGNVTNSPKSCRKTSSPAGTSNGTGENERGFFQDPHRSSLQIGAALRSQLISVQMKSVSVSGVEDVSESTASLSPREKRRKSLE